MESARGAIVSPPAKFKEDIFHEKAYHDGHRRSGCARVSRCYASYAYRHPQNVTVVAVADPDPEKRAAAKERFHLPDSACYPDMETLLQQPRLADVAVIATQDRQHIAHALPALEKGYHLLLEKPISPDVQECIALRDAAHRCGRVVAVAHTFCAIPKFSLP